MSIDSGERKTIKSIKRTTHNLMGWRVQQISAKATAAAERAAAAQRERCSQVRLLAREEARRGDARAQMALRMATGGHGVWPIVKQTGVSLDLASRLVLGEETKK